MFAAGYQVDLSKATVIDTHPHAQTCLISPETVMRLTSGSRARRPVETRLFPLVPH